MAAGPFAASGLLDIDGTRLEYSFTGPQPDAAPTIVLLHEGLGCAGLWLDFPQRLAAATGLGVFAYSRAGYGQSDPAILPRPKTYMHDEAKNVLPLVLDALGLREGFLVGHSDGASIASIYAGAIQDARLRGITLIAPHFIIEDISIASIAEAKTLYETTDLRTKLARWHKHVDVAFRGWNDAWLNPDFHDWSITEYLEHIRVPVQIIQGAEDQYGTPRQLEIARQTCPAEIDTILLDGVKHSPHREAAEQTTALIAAFCASRLAASHLAERATAADVESRKA